MALAEVHTLYGTNRRSIPDMLHQMADNIENEVTEGYSPTVAMFAIQLTESGSIDFFGWGDCDAMRALAMLERGKMKVLQLFEDEE